MQIREERAHWGDGGCKDVRNDTADSVVVMTAGSRAGASHPPCRARSFSVVISLKLLLVFLELEITQMAPRCCVQTQAQCCAYGGQNKGPPGGKSSDPQNP